MCVGFTNGYDDFQPHDSRSAMAAMVPGSCVSFNRISLYHFAIFLGWGWPKGGTESEPLPLICHFSGDSDSGSEATSVRLDDFRDIIQGSTVRVYRCSCSARTRARVVADCLQRVGEAGYNALTNNCEHFVRRIINGENVSYQSVWTVALPALQVPRLLLGGMFSGSSSSSASSSSQLCSKRLKSFRSIGLIDPLLNLLEIKLHQGGLSITASSNPDSCTRDFTGHQGRAQQELHQCHSCRIVDGQYLCKRCVRKCHASCNTHRVSGEPRGACSCTHRASRPSRMEFRSFNDSPTEAAGDTCRTQ